MAASLFGQVYDSVGPFGLRVAWRVAWPGTTLLHFPPLGDVEAVTHAAGGRIEVSLESLDFRGLRSLIDETAEDQGEAIAQLAAAAEELAVKLAWRILASAAIGGALTVTLVRPRSLRGVARGLAASAAGGLVGLALMGSVVGVTRATYDVEAFGSPTYRGALEEAPWLIRTVQEGLAQFEELDTRLRNLSRNVYEMYRRVESLQPPISLANTDRVILHVSDFHNHPTAASLVVEIAEAFNVDLVLNTGDLTDFGTRIETSLLGDFARIQVPHYIVSGNHESPEVIQHLTLLPYMELLDGRFIENDGVRLAGMGDPGAQNDSARVITPAESAQMAQAINERLAVMEHRPDVIAVHNHRVAQGIQPGMAALVAYGHTHSPSVEFRDGTAYVNAGTTGGAGLRGVEANGLVPITLSVIYMRTVPKVSVVAVDILELSPVAGGFTLQRHMAPLPDSR